MGSSSGLQNAIQIVVIVVGAAALLFTAIFVIGPRKLQQELFRFAQLVTQLSHTEDHYDNRRRSAHGEGSSSDSQPEPVSSTSVELTDIRRRSEHGEGSSSEVVETDDIRDNDVQGRRPKDPVIEYH